MDKKIIKCTEYKDCNGNPFTIRTEEDPVYFQKEPLIAPLDIPVTMGAQRYYNTPIVECLYPLRGSYFIHFKYPLKVGDIIQVTNTSYFRKYFLSRKLHSSSGFANIAYEIKRLDENQFDYTDHKELKTGVTVKVTGRVKDKKDCE